MAPERPVRIHCTACGCEDESEIDSVGGFPPDSRAWRLLTHEANLVRQGGCLAECPCHPEYAEGKPQYKVFLNTPHGTGLRFPVRPEFHELIRLAKPMPQ